MSWFSLPSPSSSRLPHRPPPPPPDPDGNAADAQHDDLAAPGLASRKGVKEDLSELTKSFTRQLWGVASFLAPPPKCTASEELVTEDFPGQAIGPGDMPISSAKSLPEEQGDSSFFAFEREDNSLASADSRRVKASVDPMPANSPSQPAQAREHGIASASNASESHRRTGQRLTGVRNDLAEFRGSVAIGLSRIIKVVREEIEREDGEQHADHKLLVTGNEIDEEADESASSAESPESPRFNSLLRPLFHNVLSADRREDGNMNNGNERQRQDREIEQSPEILQLQDGSRTLSLSRRLASTLDDISELDSSLNLPYLNSNVDYQDRSNSLPQAVGVTDEVLTFARNISMHPETWLDFPLFPDDDDCDDFEMSEVQLEHIAAVELVAPRLAALRIELCPVYMSEGHFWKIYFVLLHSRLSKKDAILLSSPQVVEARALLQELQKKIPHIGGSVSSSKSEGLSTLHGPQKQSPSMDFSDSVCNQMLPTAESCKIVSLQTAIEIPHNVFQQNQDQDLQAELVVERCHKSDPNYEVCDEFQNKDVLASTVKFAALRYEDEGEVDDWLNEEPSFNVGASVVFGIDEDVSFSDLEEEDENNMCSDTSKNMDSCVSDKSNGWVQLDENSSLYESGENIADLTNMKML